jgi:hypothetical protein
MLNASLFCNPDTQVDYRSGVAASPDLPGAAFIDLDILPGMTAADPSNGDYLALLERIQDYLLPRTCVEIRVFRGRLFP